MDNWLAKLGFQSKYSLRIPIATRLILSFLLIIAMVSLIFSIVGIRLIGDRIVAEAQENVRQDLNSAREIYLSKLTQTSAVIRYTADRFFLRDGLLSRNYEQVANELSTVKDREGLDILSVTNETGVVLLRSNNVSASGDNRSGDELIMEVIRNHTPIAATSIIPVAELEMESKHLADQACCKLIDTPLARVTKETEETDGMMLKAAAPIMDDEDNLIGVLYGGILLNRNYAIVDKIKETVFEDLKYQGKDIGTATIFQDDVRISTNVRNDDGLRALGTRVSEEVYRQVVERGEPWIERAYVVNDWYISAYEPIRNVHDEIIGILYVGLLEQKYVDIQRQTILAFMGITLLGVIISIILAYLLSQRFSVPIREMAIASKEIAGGNLDTVVEVTSKDELGDLAEAFNTMAAGLKQRDKQLREFTQSKIMESERLALIGQLAANVAHELNNPLQGIVTYSNLLLERMSNENSSTSSIQKIATQANRCRDIIRGLLDFSRQRKPDKTICDINSVMEECVAFLENQAIFHNIKITKAFAENLPKIVVDPSQMQQVFINIIVNAAEAIEDQGSLSIETRLLRGEDQIEIEIKDTGEGIPEENLDKLFDPFFTTKEVGHGTGLGLAISYGIIKEHKGKIFVETEVDKGTTFFIHLPVKAVEEVVDA
jgi:two-component system NtrC family sensor kinase